MFHPYFELGGRIRKHYLSPSVFLSLASGQFVPPIHRRTLYSLQYSMLPAERASASELWELLTQRDVPASFVPYGVGSLHTPDAFYSENDEAMNG
jgi:phosphatidylinositol glycan class Q protein